jgi:putative transposase
VGRSSVQRILKEAGLVPAPTRRGRAGETPWRKFIRLHVDTLVACDFFTKNVITPLGTRLAFCLAFIHVGTRRVYLSPTTYEPNERWVMQQARNMTMWLDEQGLKARFLLHDRDGKFSGGGFRRLLRSEGIQEVRTPVLAPDANAYIESWIGCFKREALDHFLCFGLHHFDHIAQEYARFHNTHRPHQGLGNRTIPAAATGAPEVLEPPDDTHLGTIQCQRFLGGLLRHYSRDAA